MQYRWYELIDEPQSGITQGDILHNCIVPTLVAGTKFLGFGGKMKAKLVIVDGIVLTQACDIKNKKVNNIIICPVIKRADFEADMKKKGKNKKEIDNTIQSIAKGQQSALHILNKYENKNKTFKSDYLIVNFKDIYSLPIEMAEKNAHEENPRLRLLPPYREHLSQAFARYFMRIGLPENLQL